MNEQLNPSEDQSEEKVPPAKFENGQWNGVPLSQFPKLQEQIRKGLEDGTLQFS